MNARSHTRKNLLTGEWLLVSPHRTERPWHGQIEAATTDDMPAYDENCYLCPGNARAGGQRNPEYSGGFAFDNDFPAVSADAGKPEMSESLFEQQSMTGHCRVVCYHEQHNKRLATMSVDEVTGALDFLFEEFALLDKQPNISYVQMFENRGAMMGCSNMHPHAQIWASSQIPTELEKERATQQAWFDQHGRPLLSDYIDAEIRDGARLLHANDGFAAVVPYWAVWPYETLIVARNGIADPAEFDAAAIRDLAQTIRVVLAACDRLFETSTPYSLGFHPRPSAGGPDPGWVFHVHICPPLLRSATIRKHMVGFEMFAMPQRDLTPELAAERLRKFL